MKKFVLIQPCIAMLLLFGSCNDTEESVRTVGFATTSTTVDEDQGTIDIPVTSMNTVTTDVEIAFEITGTAYLNGDYRLETPSPVKITAGTSTAQIKISVLDERVIETEDDEISIKILSVSSGASIAQDENALTHTITIRDNDERADDELQIDLTWDVGDNEDIDQANFDLFLATDVVIEDGAVTDASIYDASENPNGFETVALTASDADAEYYVVIYYNEGDVGGDYSLHFNGMGLTNELVTNSFTADDAGYAIFFGPFYKSGTSIGRQKQAQMRRSRLVPRGS